MAQFKNVSGGDLEVVVDGTPRHVPDGDVFEVPDEHADRLRLQPSFKEQKPAKNKDEVA